MPHLIPFTFFHQISFALFLISTLVYLFSVYIFPYFILRDISRLIILYPYK
uniref:ATP synthase protein 8 n=1 Tax=Zancudomyces culisetae TaxID=1213189 RepID=Q3T4D1_ZANCU|nr:ATP synthase F0 subunit 8 [Zancudomyces culisetae]AAW49483.1 ATP synthase F0 subunit 8 [Zancudomyces culisetae]